MSDLRTAAQQALEAWQRYLLGECPQWKLMERFEALRDALAQQEEPVREPLSLTDLQEALVLTNLIDRDAIDDSEEYDEGSTLAQIDALYRIIIKERV